MALSAFERAERSAGARVWSGRLTGHLDQPQGVDQRNSGSPFWKWSCIMDRSGPSSGPSAHTAWVGFAPINLYRAQRSRVSAKYAQARAIAAKEI